MLRYAAISQADPTDVWPLLARPDSWSAWAPHVRGAWHLGAPEVREGARGAARLLGVIPVPARITDVEPGRSWTWQVGPVSMRHTVEPAPEGSEVSVTLASRAPVEAGLATSYGPLVQLLVTRLARVAEMRQAGNMSSGLSSYQTEADRKALEEQLKVLEAQAQKAQASSGSEEDLLNRIRDIIRDLQGRLAAIQAAQGDDTRAIGGT